MSALRASILLLLPALALAGCSGKDADSGDDDDDTSEAPLSHVPIVAYVDFQFQGRPVTAYIPENPTAFTWLFHGTNGGVEYARKLETIATKIGRAHV